MLNLKILNQNNRHLLVRMVMFCLASSVASIWACSVPVFRYAMEHWPADPYQTIVFHRGDLSESQQSLVAKLDPDDSTDGLSANISLLDIDLDEESRPEVIGFWEQLEAERLPWLVVRYPLEAYLPGNVWSGPLSEEAVEQVLDSPVRQEIVNRLTGGQSGVWVLLEIGDAERDEAAAKLIESRLAYLATVLQLPELAAEDIANGLVSVGDQDLRLEFSMLRVSRNAPAEQAFVKMLLGVEPDLVEIDEPMVFPIFGRGRALYALAGAGINHGTIDEAASFLIGSCSCEVKELNPGVDLLVDADWDKLLEAADRAARGGEMTPLPSAEAVDSTPITVTISGDDDLEGSNPRDSDETGAITGFWVAMACALAGLLAGGLVFLWRK